MTGREKNALWSGQHVTLLSARVPLPRRSPPFAVYKNSGPLHPLSRNRSNNRVATTLTLPPFVTAFTAVGKVPRCGVASLLLEGMTLENRFFSPGL